MAKTFSLAVYAITIHTHGNKNDRQVLSDFDNGQDFLDYMDTMITSWKQDLERGDQYVPVNTDAEPNAQQGNAYRLSRKPDGTYYLYRKGRYLSGIIESGDYGTQEDGVDILTGELKFQKNAGEALMKPFYFMFYIPQDSNIGFLLIEKISNYGIMTVLNNATSSSLLKHLSRFPITRALNYDGVEVSENEFSVPCETADTPMLLLYQSGYLTIASYDCFTQRYEMKIPNNEVRKGLIDCLMPIILKCAVADNNSMVAAVG